MDNSKRLAAEAVQDVVRRSLTGEKSLVELGMTLSMADCEKVVASLKNTEKIGNKEGIPSRTSEALFEAMSIDTRNDPKALMKLRARASDPP